MLARAAERYPRLTLWFVVTALGLAMLEGRIRRLVRGIIRIMELWLILSITLSSGFLFSTFLMNYGGSYNWLLRIFAGLVWLASAAACFVRYGYYRVGVVDTEYHGLTDGKYTILSAQENGQNGHRFWNIWIRETFWRDQTHERLYQLPAELVDFNETAWETRLLRYQRPIRGHLYRLDVHSSELRTDFDLRRNLEEDILEEDGGLEDDLGLSD